MHQTFYIDIDEEITSIVDRIRKSKADEVVIVVPKRALLIQSIVNLKLLKKEAENLRRQIMIVTQDKLGKLLIEKAGILVQQKLDEGLEEVLVFEDENKEKAKVEMEDKKRKGNTKETRELGSDEYYPQDTASGSEVLLAEKKLNAEKEEFENITNKELVTGISRQIRQKKGIFNIGKDSMGKLDMVKNVKIKEEEYLPEDGMREKQADTFGAAEIFKTGGGEKASKKLEQFFSQNRETSVPSFSKPAKDNFQNSNVSRKFRKFFISFGILAIAAILIVGAYLFLPKASVKIYAKNKTTVLDNEIKGDKKISQIEIDKEAIPASEIATEDELSQVFNSSGAKSISNQKAKGKITIYNEYSAASQDLVVTTRFLSEDGKIFRLSKGVTVPGTEVVGGETKPGAIEADVVADEAGENYNIGPTSFTIPGFKDSGSEKYSKFYAKSTGSMAGGGKGNEEIGVITQSDIDKAKSTVLSNLNSKLKDDLKQKAGEGTIIPDEAVSFEDAVYTVSNSVGEVSENFSLTLKSKARALAVKESDIKDLINMELAKKEEKASLENTFITLEFGKTDADFNAGEVIMRIHSNVKVSPEIDLVSIKKGILGKNEDQLKAYLSSYKDIEKVVVDYWPPFISGKIPIYEKRVDVSLDNI